MVEGARANLLDYCRYQIASFKTPPHIKLIAETLEKVERGELRRVAISCPPRHGKSMLCSELFPAWYLGRNPSNYIITSTYAQDLADDFGRKVRNQIADEQYRSVFPDVSLASDSSSARRFHTTARGSYSAVGVGGPITGRGAMLLLIDDPIKGHEEADSAVQRKNLVEWYKSVALTRLQDAGGKPGAIILIGTRWHEDDLIGWVLSEEGAKHEDWTVISLPAIADAEDILGREPGEALWPSAFPLSRLNEIKRTEGSRQWSSLYMQSPTVEGGNIFRREWWQAWDRKDKDGAVIPPAVEYIVQAYDTAYSEKKSADFTAITTWGVFTDDIGVKCAILLGAYNKRVEFPELRMLAQQLYKKWPIDTVIIEEKGSGQSLVQDLRRSGIPLSGYRPDKDKVTRAYAVQTLFESGRIYYPKGKFWAEELIDQAAGFPYGKHDDLVDSMVLALTRLQRGYFITSKHDPELEPYSQPKTKGYW